MKHCLKGKKCTEQRHLDQFNIPKSISIIVCINCARLIQHQSVKNVRRIISVFIATKSEVCDVAYLAISIYLFNCGSH